MLKLIFLADRKHPQRFGRPITGDRYSALPFEPTPARILYSLNEVEQVALEGAISNCDQAAELSRCFGVSDATNPTYRAFFEYDKDFLSETDSIVLDNVVLEHGQKTFAEFKSFTHEMSAHRDAWVSNSFVKKFPMPFESFLPGAPDKAGFDKELKEEHRLVESFSLPARSPKAMFA